MNSAAHQKVSPQIKKGIISLKIVSIFIIFLMVLIGLLPPYIGLTLSTIVIIETTLKLRYSNSYASQNFQNFYMSCSPLWILLIDSCSLNYAHYLSVINARNLILEENRKKHRMFYFLLMVTNWLMVILFKESLFAECPYTITNNLRKDVGIILVAVCLTFSVVTNQINIILSELKATLSEVEELNSQLKVVNKDLTQALNEKDDFILLFSHETRNPLNILIGNLTLLLDEAVSSQVKEKLESCKFCADLLLQQLNNILDSGKLASKGALELSPTPVNVSEYIQSISSFMEMLAKKKGTIRSELVIPEILPTALKFDMQRFTQVCLNLLTNSLKFTESGSIALVVRYIRKDVLQETDYYPSSDFGHRLLSSSTKKTFASPNDEIGEESGLETLVAYKRQFIREIANIGSKKKMFTGIDSPERGHLKIEINDTGCGIKPEDLKKLFKKFSQAHSEVAQRQIGSGLGLWITKSLCELMGGNVRAYSMPNIGSCFVAIIQADCLPSSRPHLASLHLSMLVPNSVKFLSESQIKRILLVDDDPFNLQFHGQIIKSFGFDSIETAIDGQKLVEQFKKRPEGYFEAIVTDIAMPHLDGIGAARLIRKFEEEENRSIKVKIGFITGHSNQKDKTICEQEPLSCWFYLSKPIKAAVLEGFLPRITKSSASMTPNRRALIPFIDQTICPAVSKKKSFHISSSPNISLSSAPLILCVDDDVFNLDFLEELLVSLGAKVVRATSGEESLRIMKSAIKENVKEKIPRMVLMDCRMSNMDGWTASKRMKEMLTTTEYGRKRRIPIIGVTGDDKHQNQEKLKLSGMEEILQKPIQKEELQALLTKYS